MQQNLDQQLAKISIVKAEACKKNDTIIIAADTIVCINNAILTKPSNSKSAKKMLQTLSAKAHIVKTSCCILLNTTLIQWIDETKVYVNKIDNHEIDSYLTTNEYIDKAGSYAIQGHGACFIDKIEGSYHNVVGLPVSNVYKHLRSLEKH
jgi:septum formation protein